MAHPASPSGRRRSVRDGARVKRLLLAVTLLYLHVLRFAAGFRPLDVQPLLRRPRQRLCCAAYTSMQLEFPRREAQQSRQYNVAKVRGGYYISDKHGDAPMEEVIASKLADVGPGSSEEATAEQVGTDAMVEDALELRYLPSLDPADPIVADICRLELATEVYSFELLDSRWNGNEVLHYVTDQGSLFVKMNRVEDVSVFKAEAVSLTSMLRTKSVAVPKPLHVGTLPKVGLFGPGAFLITDFLKLEPFGALKAANQKTLGTQLAKMHCSDALDSVHQGRFGFVVNNLLSLSPQDNTWHDSWPDFFYARMLAQVNAAYKSTAWGRSALPADDMEFGALTQKLLARLPELLAGTEDAPPALLHGDLWVGNCGATADGPVVFDPACFFGHSEYDLAIGHLFGGFSPDFYEAYHALVPKAKGFETRQKIYCLSHYLNQLNLFGDPVVRDTCVTLIKELVPDARDFAQDFPDELPGGDDEATQGW